MTFTKPRLPQRESPQLTGGKGSLVKRGDGPSNLSTLDKVIGKYTQQPRKVSNLIGLSDATGSMAPVWDATRQHIKEMITRISELGEFQMKWVAYRDYCDGD